MLILAVSEFLYHTKVHFVDDDLWYLTNLATNEPLTGFKDIIQGQIWHYNNWGGRSITHTLLQAILMGGELFADILNVLVTFLLSYVISLFTSRKSFRLFAMTVSFTLLISLNASVLYSMFWQSGSVNYLYSSVWIVLYTLTFIRTINNPDIPALRFVSFWIVPLGLFTGWSNENMGPAAAAVSLLTILYFRMKLKRKTPVWMYLGTVSAFIGSALVILAPGNFVRSEFTEGGGLITTLTNRFMQMLEGLSSFLLPSFALVILLLYTIRILKIQLKPGDFALIVNIVLAFGAMLLSPHFPPRASFGIMVLCIGLILSLTEKITDEKPEYMRCANCLLAVSFVYSLIKILMSFCDYFI